MKVIWLVYTVLAILLWSATDLLYKAGVHKEKENYTSLKFSISVGLVFLLVALYFLIVRDEPFSIFESAIRFWPMTAFGILFAIVNTFSFKGYIYNEVSVESPVEGIGGGVSVILLIIAYLLLGRVKEIGKLLNPLIIAGVSLILISVILLAVFRNKEDRKNMVKEKTNRRSRWKIIGLGTLIFPLAFAMIDAVETIVTGLCLDTTYGFGMPEGDSIIIIGLEYAFFALIFWIFVYIKERKIYQPFRKENLPRLFAGLANNVGLVFYSFAMAIDSVTSDAIIAVYPVFVMIGGRIFMKEKVNLAQKICLLATIAGSVLVCLDELA